MTLVIEELGYFGATREPLFTPKRTTPYSRAEWAQMTDAERQSTPGALWPRDPVATTATPVRKATAPVSVIDPKTAAARMVANLRQYKETPRWGGIPSVRTFQASAGRLGSDGQYGPNARAAAAWYLGQPVSNMPPVHPALAKYPVTWTPPGGATVPVVSATPTPASSTGYEAQKAAAQKMIKKVKYFAQAPGWALQEVRDFQAADGRLGSDGLYGNNARAAAAWYLGQPVSSMPPVHPAFARGAVTWTPPVTPTPAKPEPKPEPAGVDPVDPINKSKLPDIARNLPGKPYTAMYVQRLLKNLGAKNVKADGAYKPSDTVALANTASKLGLTELAMKGNVQSFTTNIAAHPKNDNLVMVYPDELIPALNKKLKESKKKKEQASVPVPPTPSDTFQPYPNMPTYKAYKVLAIQKLLNKAGAKIKESGKWSDKIELKSLNAAARKYNLGKFRAAPYSPGFKQVEGKDPYVMIEPRDLIDRLASAIKEGEKEPKHPEKPSTGKGAGIVPLEAKKGDPWYGGSAYEALEIQKLINKAGFSVKKDGLFKKADSESLRTAADKYALKLDYMQPYTWDQAKYPQRNNLVMIVPSDFISKLKKKLGQKPVEKSKAKTYSSLDIQNLLVGLGLTFKYTKGKWDGMCDSALIKAAQQLGYQYNSSNAVDGGKKVKVDPPELITKLYAKLLEKQGKKPSGKVTDVAAEQMKKRKAAEAAKKKAEAAKKKALAAAARAKQKKDKAKKAAAKAKKDRANADRLAKEAKAAAATARTDAEKATAAQKLAEARLADAQARQSEKDANTQINVSNSADKAAEVAAGEYRQAQTEAQETPEQPAPPTGGETPATPAAGEEKPAGGEEQPPVAAPVKAGMGGGIVFAGLAIAGLLYAVATKKKGSKPKLSDFVDVESFGLARIL